MHISRRKAEIWMRLRPNRPIIFTNLPSEEIKQVGVRRAGEDDDE